MLVSCRTLGVFFAAVLVGLAACSNDQGQTPSCDFNVGRNGIIPDDSGCEQFAVCAASPSDPTQCCVDAGDRNQCLYGYGVAAPTDGGS